jgi:hypothetical protein
MLVLYENAATFRVEKPIICPKCKRGRIGSIPEWSKATISRRGKPPPKERGESVCVKCNVCGSFWTLTIE